MLFILDFPHFCCRMVRLLWCWGGVAAAAVRSYGGRHPTGMAVVVRPCGGRRHATLTASYAKRESGKAGPLGRIAVHATAFLHARHFSGPCPLYRAVSYA